MLRVVIVDDEPLARQGMRQLLAAYGTISIVGEAATSANAARVISQAKPDVVFLDVDMPGKDGFALLDTLPFRPHVVFVTAYAEHAVRAFEVQAVDYLLKPVRAERLQAVLLRLEGLVRLEPTSQQNRQNAMLRLKIRDRMLAMPVENVIALCAERDYTRVLIDNVPPVLVGQVIGDLQASLPAAEFVRLGRSLVINITKLREIRQFSRDETTIRLDGWNDPFKLGRAATYQLKRVTK